MVAPSSGWNLVVLYPRQVNDTSIESSEPIELRGSAQVQVNNNAG